MPSVSTQAKILLVEDNPADSRLFQEALKAADSPHTMSVARDGVEALQMLGRGHDSSTVALPDLILLDLNLPGMSGWELLNVIKEDKELRQIPVVILTSSHSPDDIANAYRSHANSYLCKPVRLAEMFDLVAEIQRYWFQIAALPPRSQAG